MKREKEKEALQKAADEATVQIVRLIKQRNELDQRIEALRGVILTRDEAFGRKTPSIMVHLRPEGRAKWGTVQEHLGAIVTDAWMTISEVRDALYHKVNTWHEVGSVKKALQRGEAKGIYERDRNKWRKAPKPRREVVVHMGESVDGPGESTESAINQTEGG